MLASQYFEGNGYFYALVEWQIPADGFIDDRAESVTVRRLCQTTLVEPEILRSNQLRALPSDRTALAVRARGHEVCRVRHDREQPEVSEASMTSFVN